MSTLQELYEREGVSKKVYFYLDDSPEPIPDEYVHQGSFKLNRNICTDTNLRFGGCLSSYISLRLSNALGKLKGKKLTIIQKVEDNIVKLGQYYVDTDTPSIDKKYRDITAYDILYTKKSVDMSDWYVRLIFPMKVKKLRDLFFAKLGLTQVDITLPNDDTVLVYNPDITGILASAIMIDICAINGCFGRINEDGLFDYVFLQTENPMEIGKNLQKKLSYEDYITHDINQIKFTQPNMDADFYYGDGDNQYPLSLSVLCTSTEEDAMSLLCSNVYPHICNIRFTPIDIRVRGNLALYPGQYIKTYGYNDEELYTYALQQSYTFISEEGITGQYIANGTEIYTRDVSDSSQAIYMIDNEIQTIYRNNFYAYTFTNEDVITVDTSDKIIIKYNISATAQTEVIFVAMIPINMTCDARVVIDYLIDAAVVEKDKISVLLPKGEQLIPLTNFIPIGQDGRLTLTLSIRMEYEETENRVQNANIVSLTNFVKNGTYNEPVIDTSLCNATIPLNAIKAVVFAKGLAGETPWDGTINVTDAVGLFTVPNKNVTLNTLSDNVITYVKDTLPTTLAENIELFKIQKSVATLNKVTDVIYVSGETHWYIISTDTKDVCIYNSDYVKTATQFELNTQYLYTATSSMLDEGVVQELMLDFTQFSQIDEVVMTIE